MSNTTEEAIPYGRMRAEECSGVGEMRDLRNIQLSPIVASQRFQGSPRLDSTVLQYGHRHPKHDLKDVFPFPWLVSKPCCTS
jgi:hypothetical protein